MKTEKSYADALGVPEVCAHSDSFPSDRRH